MRIRTQSIITVLFLMCMCSFSHAGWEIIHDNLEVVPVDMWGASPNDIHAVGRISDAYDQGGILHYNGKQWASQSTGGDRLIELWGNGPNDIFAAGYNYDWLSGVIWHYDGQTWKSIFEESRVLFYGIWGGASDDVYAVGQDPYNFYYGGLIYHFDGVEWTRLNPFLNVGDDEFLVGIVGNSSKDIYVNSLYGRLFHYDGSAWAEIERPDTHYVDDMWADGVGGLWTAGERSIRFYDGQDWHKKFEVEESGLSILAGDGQGVLMAGYRQYYSDRDVIYRWDGQATLESSFADQKMDILGIRHGPGEKFYAFGEKSLLGLTSQRGAIMEFRPGLDLQVPPAEKETRGLIEDGGQVSLNLPFEHDLQVTLDCTSSAVSVPNTVLIPAGEKEVYFDIVIPDDQKLNGSREVEITVGAPGCFGDTKALRVDDDESASLSLRLPGQAKEGDGFFWGMGIVSILGIADEDIKVWLTSDNPTKVQVPEFTTIPQGSFFARFDFYVGDDYSADGDQVVGIQASVPGWNSETGSIEVLDNDNAPRLFFSVLPRSENSYALGMENDSRGYIWTDAPFDGSLEVTLDSSDPDLLTLPSSIVLNVSGSPEEFDIDVNRESYSIGNRNITITASSPGFESAQYVLSVDHDRSPWQLDYPGTEDGIPLNASWVSDSGIVVSVGDESAIYEGFFAEGYLVSLNKEPFGGGPDLLGIDGSGYDNLYAVGAYGTILHFDGQFWFSQESPVSNNLNAVWLADTEHIYTVGRYGTILHGNGTEWTSMESHTEVHFHDVWGSRWDDVFAVGDEGTILHYDGQNWSAMESGTNDDLVAIWGTSSSNVYVLGGTEGLFHYDGKCWNSLASLIAGLGDGDYYNTWEGYYYSTAVSYLDIWGRNEQDIYILTREYVLHFDGDSWSIADAPSSAYWKYFGPIYIPVSPYYPVSWGYSGVEIYGHSSLEILGWKSSHSVKSPESDKNRICFQSYTHLTHLAGSPTGSIIAAGGMGLVGQL